MRFSYTHQIFEFKTPAGTSRGILNEKHSYFIEGHNEGEPPILAEVSLLEGLSPETIAGVDMDRLLSSLCADLNADSTNILRLKNDLQYRWPAIWFALDCLERQQYYRRQNILFPDSAFVQGKPIAINGLIWMNPSTDNLMDQAELLVERGFRCLKVKVGARVWEEELHFLKRFREAYPDLELRLDANGAFSATEALDKLEQLIPFEVHSIEQPIAPGQHGEMQQLIRYSPVAIALDEELAGLTKTEDKITLIKQLAPQYLILKPSLIGGFREAEEWAGLADIFNVGWWATSALESNVGLNAIAQWAGSNRPTMPQGLGTGSLFLHNTEPSMIVEKGSLRLKNPL